MCGVAGRFERDRIQSFPDCIEVAVPHGYVPNLQERQTTPGVSPGVVCRSGIQGDLLRWGAAAISRERIGDCARLEAHVELRATSIREHGIGARRRFDLVVSADELIG